MLLQIERELAAAQAQAATRAISVAQEKAANEAKSEFMSLMCHEVGCSSSGGGAVLALRSPHAVCPCHPALPLRPNPSPNPSPPTLPQVRTPLNGCLASAEMLLDTQLDEDQRELAKTIRVSGSILHSTVSNFLDYFKMGEGRADPAACTFAVAVVRCWGGEGEGGGCSPRSKKLA